MDQLVGKLGRQALHRVREDIFPRIEREVRETITPRVERPREETRLQRKRRRRPPSNTDIVYLTDRFLVSSKPAVDNHNGKIPSYNDKGRDETKTNASRTKQQQQQQNKNNHQRWKPGVSYETNSNQEGATISALSHQSILEEDEEEPPTSENPQDGGTMPEGAETETIPSEVVNETLDREWKRRHLLAAATQVPLPVSPSETRSKALSDAIETPLPASPLPLPIDRKRSRSDSFLAAVGTPLPVSPMPMPSPIPSSPTGRTTPANDNDNDDGAMDGQQQQQQQQEFTTPLTQNITKRVLAVGSWDDENVRLPTIPSVTLFPPETTVVSPEHSDQTGTDNDSFYSTKQEQDETKSIMDEQHSGPEPTTSSKAISAAAMDITPIFNSPGTMAAHLDKIHGRDNYLVMSLAKEPPDDRTLLLFRRQIVLMGINEHKTAPKWSPCCVERSETPSIPHILKICYALHAYLQMDPNHVVLTYCDNGKTRTAIVAACYLKFSDLVDTTEDGFRYFFKSQRRQSKLWLENERQRRQEIGPMLTRAMDALLEDYANEAEEAIIDNILQQLPPSLKLFFQQFDRALQLGGFLNRKPLLLRAVTLQGIPVEEQPRVDIWDSSQKHVYSSHSSDNAPKSSSQWIDEEGFYRIGVVLDGDFLVLCRFGGASDPDDEQQILHDPSKILFRYTNTTGFMSGGYPYELQYQNVDLMRMYKEHLEAEDFLVTLLFESDWEHEKTNDLREALAKTSEVCGNRIWRSFEKESIDEGWKVIFEHHCARPLQNDIDAFRQYSSAYENCPDHLTVVCLQLTNYDFLKTSRLLVESPIFSWWRDDENDDDEPAANTPKYNQHDNVSLDAATNRVTEKRFEGIQEKALQTVLGILESMDVISNLETHDRTYLRTFRGSSPKPSNTANSNSQSRLCLKETGNLIPSIFYPQRGDISRSFQLHGESSSNSEEDKNSAWMRAASKIPRMHYFPDNKPKPLPPQNDRVRTNDRTGQRMIPSYNPKLEAAKEIHSQIRHTGVTLDMFVKLEQASKQWGDVVLKNSETEKPDVVETTSEEEKNVAELRDSTMNREEREKKEKEWKEAQKAQAEEKKQQQQSSQNEENMTVAEEKKDEQEEEVPLKDDPEYAKYFKMLKLGMPREQVLHAFQRDGKDPKVLDLNPNKSLESQIPDQEGRNDDDEELPLKDNPDYTKYFKMLKMGMPREQVLHALKRDEKDPKILDLDPNKSLQSQLSDPGKADQDDGPPLQDDPEYAKYFKMLKMGMPKEQVLHAFQRDGKDPSILDLDPNKSLKSQQEESTPETDDGPPLKFDPEYSKYFKMMKMGMPKEQVLHALKRDNKDPTILDLDPNKSLKAQQNAATVTADDGPPLKDDPEYAKYFKMEKMGLPRGAVKNALVRDGKDPSIADLNPNMSLKSQTGGAAPEEKDIGTPLKDDPEYTKYFKMEKMGLPRDAVRNALVRDGKNPAIVDLDPNMSVEFQLRKSKPAACKKLVLKKKKVRRKKIYWNPIDPSKLKKDSLWNIVRDHVAMGNLDYDQKEFEELFTEDAEAGAQKAKKGPVQKEAKKLVQAIDPKRSMNGGIVLSRIKTGHKQVAEYVDRMEHNKFDATQLKNLLEYLATADERRALVAYMSKGADSEEKKAELYTDLSETEKYMVTLMEVADAEGKLRTMEFRNGFKNRYGDMIASVRTLNTACDELRSSEKFRKLMAVILTVVNQINTGGEGNLAMGFTLDALLKLNEAKAFDKKTSVLHYVVKLVKKNDESLLLFENDLSHVIPAESVLLDTVVGDMKALEDELSSIIEIVSKEAEKLEKAGKLPKFTLAELMEQKSIVQHVGEVPQYNKITHLTGRTSMERFAMNAKVACEHALTSVENVKAKYALVLGYFGEDESMPTGDFFGILRRFMAEWKKATIQVEKIEKQQAKEKKREAKRLAKENKIRGTKLSAGKTGAPLKNVPNRDTIEVPNKLPVGGIAAIAAGAALKRSKEANERPPPGDIADLAGQAALAKTQHQESKKLSNKLPPGGIAALAAQAALAKAQNRESKESTSKPPPGVIATLAAEAALEKNQGTRLKTSHQPPVEVATTAITTRNFSQCEELDNIPSQSQSGSIATLAAVAALNMAAVTKNAEEASLPQLEVSGIADEATMEQSEGSPNSQPQIGGVAALAAQVALEKVRKEDTLAAQAALQKSEARLKKEMSLEPQAGGILVVATETALERLEKEGTLEEVQQQGQGNGIAAHAALETGQSVDEGDTFISSTGGITKLAAYQRPQAAQKQAPLHSQAEEAPVGINVPAAHTAMRTPQKQETNNNDAPVGIFDLDAQVDWKNAQKQPAEEALAVDIVTFPAQTAQTKAERGSNYDDEENEGTVGNDKALATNTQLHVIADNQESEEISSVSGLEAIFAVHPPTNEMNSPGKEGISPAGGLGAALAAHPSPNEKNRSPAKEGTSSTSVRGAVNATQVSQEKTADSIVAEGTSVLEGLGAALTEHETPEKNNVGMDVGPKHHDLVDDLVKETPPSGGRLLEALGAHNSQKKAIDNPSTYATSPVGGLGAALEAHDSPKKAVYSLTKEKTSKQVSVDGLGAALVAYTASKETKGKTPEEEPPTGLAALAVLAAIQRAIPKPAPMEPAERSPKIVQNEGKPTSLGDFFEQQTSIEIRKEILRQNYDDSSVAIMAGDLEEIKTSDANQWNEDGGISDYMGWANQAIISSDTESVRGFEASRHIVEHYDDDESTIATAFDDDASIAMEPMTTHENGDENENGDGYYEGGDYYDNTFNDSSAAIYDPYSSRMAYGDAVINMPENFDQDKGLNGNLSFDNPQRYGNDDPSRYDEYSLGFGQDTGLGGFGLISPTFQQPANHNTTEHDRPRAGTTPKNNNTEGSLDKPWGATPATPAAPTTESDNDNVVFRGWGEPTPPKEPEPSKKKWFW